MPLNFTNEITATLQKTVKCGIWSLDADVFQDADYFPSSVTDRPEPLHSPEVQALSESSFNASEVQSSAPGSVQNVSHSSASHLDWTR